MPYAIKTERKGSIWSNESEALCQGGCQVEYEERTGVLLDVPDLDLPVGPAAQEDVGDEGVPLEAVDRAVVGQEGGQELRAVLGGAVVDTAQLCPYQVQAPVIRLERDALNSVCNEGIFLK